MTTTDPFDRFVRAQAPLYETVKAELRAGCKVTHWMWFIFPQLRGLGVSATAQHYALASLDDARAYHLHPLLGARLRECATLTAAISGRAVRDFFGSPDDVKLGSSMTLFAHAAPSEPVFRAVLERFYGGEEDGRTVQLLGGRGRV